MKRNTIPKPALAYLIIGLLFTSLIPIISRFFVPIPDLLKGLLNGIGLALEVIAIVKIQKSKKETRCIVPNA